MAENTNDASLEGSIGRKIDKVEFLELTRAYRDQRLNLISRYGNNTNDSRSCLYSRDILESILGSGCSGVRAYYGVRTEPTDSQQYTTLVLVGIKKNASTGIEEVVKIFNGLEEEEVLYEWGSLCPPDDGCSSNPLLIEIDSDL
ncbi:hypothetical protein TH63_18640 [Rufibacter radiotolerans]|uniref:Uncharacterized protein n=1 Tax=Rufibacter radiotolerans TaxID=1379910 RepID=A0A0H4W9R1_9BACT|nr:hypothetical protein [Rufibacter radiotolerans]AKQ47201.1 hypothetical protein TH63_18640 [Rufibacter radiotolerans]